MSFKAVLYTIAHFMLEFLHVILRYIPLSLWLLVVTKIHNMFVLLKNPTLNSCSVNSVSIYQYVLDNYTMLKKAKEEASSFNSYMHYTPAPHTANSPIHRAEHPLWVFSGQRDLKHYCDFLMWLLWFLISITWKKKSEGVIITCGSGVVRAVMLRVFGAMSKAQLGRDFGCMNFWDLPGQYEKVMCGLSHCEPKSSLALFHVVLGNVETVPKGEPWTKMPVTWCGEQGDRIWQGAEESFGTIGT